MKLRIRYATKADLPKGFEAFYSPVDENNADGQQMFSGFESDPDGYALTNASQLQRDLKKLNADKARADQTLSRYRKPNSTDLRTPEEIEELERQAAELAELRGKTPDIDSIRKAAAAEVKQQMEAQLRALNAQLESERKAKAFYNERYKERIRMTEASQAMLGMQALPGLEEVALDRFAREIDLEEFDTEEGMKDYRSRIKGPNGHRIDAQGNPIAPSAYAKTEFRKKYASMFAPSDESVGTGHQGTKQKPPTGGGAAGKGSGKFQMKSTDLLKNVGAYRDMLKTIPKDDFLQVVDDSGAIVDTKPGQAG